MRIRPAYQNVLGRATFELNATGDGSGVSTLRMNASANTTLTLVGDANFYTDSGGTTGESKAWEVTSGALRTIYLKCATTAKLIIPEQRLITQWGNSSLDGWTSATNAASISSAGFPLRNLTSLRMSGNCTINGSLSSSLEYIRLITNVTWDHNGLLPNGFTFLTLNSSLINWTGLNVSGTGNVTDFTLSAFIVPSMTATQLITLLTSMAQRTGNLPATCTISDYSNSPTAATIAAATGDVNGTDAEKAKYWIDQIFATKATTRVTLMSVNIDKP